MKSLALSVWFAGVALTLTPGVAATTGTTGRRADQVRTVYFSALDPRGAAITDLTAADLTVREGGKDRQIAGLHPATAPMHVSILVDDSGTGAFQAAVAQFVQALFGHAQFAISVFNPQPSMLMNYTDDIGALKTALGLLGQRGRIDKPGEQVIYAVDEAAKELQQRRAARPVILALTTSGMPAQSDLADPVLNDVRASGAALNVLFITGLELGKVLGEGPKQSGGLLQQAVSGVAVGPALVKVADNLMHQYELTYTLPDGVKPNEKLSLTTGRKGVTLIAPSRLPDK